MDPSRPRKWMERGFASVLILSLFFKIFHPITGFPLSVSTFFFKVSLLLLTFFYLVRPWLFAPPLQKHPKWDRVLHFLAPILWAYELLMIFLARNDFSFLQYEAVGIFYESTEGIMNLAVLILVVQRIYGAETKMATRYYGWILGRSFLIGALAQWAIGPLGF